MPLVPRQDMSRDLCYQWPMSVRSLTYGDIDALAQVLKHAFATDPELRWVVPDADEWDRIAGPWFKMNLRETLQLGHGLTDAGYRGVSLWEPPGINRSLVARFTNLWRMATIFRGNLARAIQIQTALDGYRPSDSHWYLTYIATDPRHQGAGIGSALLSPMLALADRQQTPVFLECSNHRNIPFYLAHGFAEVAEVRLPGGPSIWPMMRDAP